MTKFTFPKIGEIYRKKKSLGNLSNTSKVNNNKPFTLFICSKHLALTLCLFVATQAFAQTFVQLKDASNSNALPVINITTDEKQLTKEKYLDGKIEIYNPQSQATETYNCALRYRGTSAMNYSKKSFALKLKNTEGKKQEANLFGLRSDDSWILDAMAIDKLRMRNILCFSLWNEIDKLPYDTKENGRNGIVGTYVELCLNGNYHGLYCLEDKVNRKLLKLDKLKEKKGKIQYGGALYKCKSWGGGSNLANYDKMEATNTLTWNAWEMKYPEEKPDETTWSALIDFINFNSDKTNDAYFTKHYHEYFYVDNFMNYLLFINTLGIIDNQYKNCYLSTVSINKHTPMVLTPWDLDASLGRSWDGKEYEDLFSVSSMKNVAPVRRLYKYDVDGFVPKMIERWNKLSSTTFHPQHLREEMQKRAERLVKSGAWRRERDKWNDNPVTLEESPYKEIEYVLAWYEQNYNHIKQELKAIATGILPHKENKKSKATDVMYDLSGRLILFPANGIYIQNGKKYLKGGSVN